MPLTQADYRELDAVALADGIRSREFSAREAVQCAVEIAKTVNPELNAIISERFEDALAQAEAGSATGALAGVPFLIKDLSAMAGLPHGRGSQLYQDQIADSSHRIAQRYVDAGLIVLGKTNTPEFGLTLTTEPVASGACRNPWNHEHSTGGSSGGAAAAVAAGIVPAAHASDGGGSIRIPASCCGLFGLKPSRGLTVTEPSLADCWSGMSVGHVLSRSVRDSAAFLDLIRWREPGLFPRPEAPDSFLHSLSGETERLRIAVQREHPFGLEVAAECQQALDHAVELCRELGHQVESIAAPLDYRPVVTAMNKLVAVHTWQAVAPGLRKAGLELNLAPLERSTHAMAAAGAGISAADYLAARDCLTAATAAMAEFHQHYQIILSPVLSLPPPALGWLDMNAADQQRYVQRFRAYGGFTALFNGSGQPSMSVPLGVSQQGLPVGSQFSAAWGQDLLLLRLARQLETLAPWPLRAPGY